MKILGHEYIVTFDKDLGKEAGSVGTCASNTQRIVLDPTYPETSIEEGLLHEVLEALKYHLNYTSDFPHTMLSQLSETLYQVIKDNPKYFSIQVPKE